MGATCTRTGAGAGRREPSIWLGGARSNVGNAAPGGEVGWGARPSLAGRARRADVPGRRNAGGAEDSRQSAGSSAAPGGRRGRKARAALPPCARAVCYLRFPRGCLPSQAPAEGTCQHVPAVVLLSHVIAPPSGLGLPPPPRPHYPQAQPSALTRSLCSSPPSRLPGKRAFRPDPLQKTLLARFHPCHLIPLPSSASSLGTPAPSGPLSLGPALR